MKLLIRTPWIRRVARFVGGQLHRWAENDGEWRASRNGELRLLDELFRGWSRSARRSEPRVVLDVGANAGSYTAGVLEAAERWNTPVRVLAFEPGPVAVAALHARHSSDPRVEVLPLAVGERGERRALHAPRPGSPLASFVRGGASVSAVVDTVDVVRLDEFLSTRGLARIDFLKLDVEGAELSALRGLGELLRPESTAVLQFEYGGTTLDAGNRLGEFFDLLEARGYVVGKLMPRDVEVRRYEPWMDHFAYANFVALSADAWNIER